MASSGRMKLSIVIPCHNAAPTLSVQLDALRKQEWGQPWEVVIVDDGSVDESVAIAARYAEGWPQLRVVRVNPNRGTAHALNVGMQAARGESIALLNADDEAAPGWVAAIGTALERHEFVSGSLDQTKLNPPWLQWPQQDSALQELWYPPFLPHAGGCDLGFSRSAADRIGGFDEALGNLEDTDFCIRMQQAGIPLVFVPEAVVHYRRRSTLRGLFRQARSYAEWNSVLAKRHDPRDGTARRYYRLFLREWLQLARDIRKLSTMGGRVSWCWRLGFQFGRLKGWTKHAGIPV